MYAGESGLQLVVVYVISHGCDISCVHFAIRTFCAVFLIELYFFRFLYCYSWPII